MTSYDPPSMSAALRALVDADNQRPGPSDSVRRGVYTALGVSLGLAPIAAVAAAEIIAGSSAAAASTATAATATAGAAGSTAVGSVASGVSILGRLVLLAKAPLASVSVGVVLGAALTTYVVKSPRSTSAPIATKAVAAETSKRVSAFNPPSAPAGEASAEAPAEAPAPQAPPLVPVARAHAVAASPALVERHATPAHTLDRAPRPTSALAEEQTLLDPARSALAHGDGAGALSLLEQHARRFPDGALAQEREAMTIHALVLTGDGERARHRADAFHARYPGSLLWPMIDATLRSR